ncbi:MAG TPA: DUF5110 domain-containing protein [Acidobacteriota bacterium]|nr:DUF5110 domain-containing protein [Acidobacteriota bacterium]
MWHYGEQSGQLRLYDDDGETFAYERGSGRWTEVRAERQADGTWRGTVPPPPAGTSWSYGAVQWKFVTQ